MSLYAQAGRCWATRLRGQVKFEQRPRFPALQRYWTMPGFTPVLSAPEVCWTRTELCLARDLLPTLFSPRPPYATVCSTWEPSLPVFVDAPSRWETCRATFCSSQTGLLLLLRLTAPPSALWCHHKVSEGNQLLAEMLGPAKSGHTRMKRFTTCGVSQALDSWEDHSYLH